MSAKKVVVFGATGSVGSQVAMSARRLGAEVVLAMRNTSAVIRGLPQENQDHGYTRVEADLTKPETVRAALRATKPTAAFLYLVRGESDHMDAVIQVLKDEGIENVVFLSSFLVRDIETTPKSSPIGWAQAQAEKNLLKRFPKYVSLRPGGFATNVLRWRPYGTEVRVHNPGFKSDWITPTDIAEVGAKVLVDGSDQQAIYLFGAKIVTLEEAVHTIGDVLHKPNKIISVGDEEGIKLMVDYGIPQRIAEYFVHMPVSNLEELLDPRLFEGGQQNIKKYTGHSPTTFAEWVSKNPDIFNKGS